MAKKAKPMKMKEKGGKKMPPSSFEKAKPKK